MRIVAAVGCRALFGRNEVKSFSSRQGGIGRAGKALSELANQVDLVVTYGDDLRALMPPVASHYGANYPLEAENEGLVGYMLEQCLQDILSDHQVVTLLTRVELDPTDPEFQRPSHPIGPVVDDVTTGALASTNRWLMVRDAAALALFQ